MICLSNAVLETMLQSIPDFSIIIPSRNRPALLREAVGSVMAQTHPSREIIVVNDGSDSEHQAVYASIIEDANEAVTFIHLEHTPNGHGPSYAINRGVEQARGRYVGFLDDDDYWTDTEHLARTAQAFGGDSNSTSVDAYFSCQAAFHDGQLVQEALWLNGLISHLQHREPINASGMYAVTVADLLRCPTFAHLNTMLIRRELYQEIGGMDETIRYECEWDLYFRIIDAAQTLRYFPGIVARHHVPDKTQRNNASTRVSNLQKLLFRINVMDKALLFSHNPHIRRTAHRNKIVSLKLIAERLAYHGQYRQSVVYAMEALIGGLNWKWPIYCAYLGLRALMARG